MKKYCQNCFKVRLSDLSITELNNEKKALQDEINHLSLLNQIHKFNLHTENIAYIEKTINSYFLITVENEFNFHRVLSGLNFYGYILEPYKEHPTKVMRLNTEIIYNDKLKYIEGIYLEEIIGDSNKGYGSKVMKSFLEYIRPLHVKYVTGTLSMVDEIDLENKSRRDHFYKKFGFKIKGSHIYLELNK